MLQPEQDGGHGGVVHQPELEAVVALEGDHVVLAGMHQHGDVGAVQQALHVVGGLAQRDGVDHHVHVFAAEGDDADPVTVVVKAVRLDIERDARSLQKLINDAVQMIRTGDARKKAPCSMQRHAPIPIVSRRS